jgi:peptidyl-prolyl cis-trans isomerase SurA
LDKVIKYYKKNTEEEFSYFFDILKENKSEMQKKIVEEVEITPEEVRNFSNQYQKRICPLVQNGSKANSNYA